LKSSRTWRGRGSRNSARWLQPGWRRASRASAITPGNIMKLRYSPSRGKFSLLIRDITERKLAERKLSESEQRCGFFSRMRLPPWPCSTTGCATSTRAPLDGRLWFGRTRPPRRVALRCVPGGSGSMEGCPSARLAGEVVKQEGECFERADGSNSGSVEIRPWHDIAGKSEELSSPRRTSANKRAKRGSCWPPACSPIPPKAS